MEIIKSITRAILTLGSVIDIFAFRGSNSKTWILYVKTYIGVLITQNIF